MWPGQTAYIFSVGSFTAHSVHTEFSESFSFSSPSLAYESLLTEPYTNSLVHFICWFGWVFVVILLPGFFFEGGEQLFCFCGRGGLLVMVVLETKHRVFHLPGKYSNTDLIPPHKPCVL